MKKITICTILILTVLCLFALSSCKKDKTIPAHDHIWGAGTVTDAGNSTCNETKTFTCSICGTTKTETFDAHNWDDGVQTLAPTCGKEGIKTYTCSLCQKEKCEVIPMTDEHSYGDGAWRIVTVPTVEEDGTQEKLCSLCGTATTEPIDYMTYKSKVGVAKNKVAAFTNEDFGGISITTDLSKASTVSYTKPTVNPTAGQHPRVLMTADDLAGIRTAMTEERNFEATKIYLSDVLAMPDGDLGEVQYYEHAPYNYTSATFNYDEKMLQDIQAMALEYQLTGNQVMGYSAVYAMKNFIKTLDVRSIAACQERQYGYIMYTAACVYDWCYDLLTATDKTQIVAGIQHKVCEGNHFEVGFPPCKQGSLTGHGCEYQILRDYLSFAIAIYDEYPGWWNYIGGRVYQEYVPVRNELYKTGMVSQGVSLYVRPRYASDLFSAWLLKAGTGVNPYDENMKEVMRTVYSYELPNGNGFASGDHHESGVDPDFLNYNMLALISSYLFDDETMRAQLESRAGSYTKFSDPNEDCFEYCSVAEYLICSSSGVKAADDVHEGMDLIRYNGGWLGQIIARNSWGDDQTAVLMKIGCKSMGNHDHADAGQFQIFYKTVLAGDTGDYDSYGTNHFKYYHQATIAHNSLLVYDPDYATATTYTGGQKQLGETDFATWKTNSYTTGKVTGVQYEYADAEKTTPTYAYIAGDISSSYTNASVYRRMLTVYDTDNPDVPMYFFVYDNITSENANAKKIFLLHTEGEAVVSGKTVTEVSEGAKLVLQNVIGGDNIVAIGGKDNNYNVNGKQLVTSSSTTNDDGYWGRVEISPNTGNNNDEMVNVIYVCDADKNPNLTATSIQTDYVKGTVLGNTAAVFVSSATRRDTTFIFTATGEGELNYYISGVAAGSWNVIVGDTIQTVTATEDGGMLVFTAAAGKVTVSPAN